MKELSFIQLALTLNYLISLNVKQVPKFIQRNLSYLSNQMII
jgi:hypothetical protein